MRLFLRAAVASVLLIAAAQTVHADTLNQGMDNANRAVTNTDRTISNADNTAERSKGLFDRVKSWFKRNTHRGGSPQSDKLVREVQQRLAALGYDPGPVDGVIGPKTLDAVRGFQQDRGLPVDPRITPALAKLLQGVGAPAPAAPAAAAQPSEADIMLALQYAAGADAHQLRCSGKRDPQYRQDFLGALSPALAARYSSAYEDEFNKQYGSVTACQPQVTQWLTTMYRQQIASLRPAGAGAGNSQAASSLPAATGQGAINQGSTSQGNAAVPTSFGVAPAPAPSAGQPGTTAGNGPPLSNPYAALSGNLALSNAAAPPSAGVVPSTTASTGAATSSAAVPPGTGTSGLDPALIGNWAWVSPQRGIVAFLDVAGNSTYQMKSSGNQSTAGQVEAHDGVLRLIAANGGDTREFRYQSTKPDEIDLVNAAGEQTVLLKSKVQ